jgi:hypothetical protein
MSSPHSTFVPLTAAAPSEKTNGEARLTVLTQASHVQPFRPLGQPSAPAPAQSEKTSCEPRVTVQRDGDRVTSIQVHCSCGEVIELGCVYGA